jgi:hypothetical protein
MKFDRSTAYDRALVTVSFTIDGGAYTYNFELFWIEVQSEALLPVLVENSVERATSSTFGGQSYCYTRAEIQSLMD